MTLLLSAMFYFVLILRVTGTGTVRYRTVPARSENDLLI